MFLRTARRSRISRLIRTLLLPGLIAGLLLGMVVPAASAQSDDSAVSYSCPDGYELIVLDGETTCQTTVVEVVDATTTTSSECPEAKVVTSADGEPVTCALPVETDVTAQTPPDETTTSTCPENTTNTGTDEAPVCVESTSSTATITTVTETTITCENGSAPVDPADPSAGCVSASGTTITIPAECPPGLVLIALDTGVACGILIEADACPDGTTEVDQACAVLGQEVEGVVTVTLDCPIGASGEPPNCIGRIGAWTPATIVTEAGCPAGSEPDPAVESPLTCVSTGAVFEVPPEITTSSVCPSTTDTINVGDVVQCVIPGSDPVPVAAVITTTYECPDGTSVPDGGPIFVCEDRSAVIPVANFQQNIPSCADGSEPLAFRCISTTVTDVSVTPVEEPVYVCPDGTTEQGSFAGRPLCVSPIVTRVPVPPAVLTTYDCAADEFQVGIGSSSECLRLGDRVLAETTVDEVCDVLSQRVGDRCLSVTDTPVEPVPGEVLQCPDGSEQQGGTPDAPECFLVVVSTVPNVSTTEYVCPPGSTRVFTGTAAVCNRPIVEFVPVAPVVFATCPAGATPVPGTSGANLECEADGVSVPPITIETCPPGSVDDPSAETLECLRTVVSTVTEPAQSVTTYSCPAGATETGGEGPALVCELRTVTDSRIAAVPTAALVCPDGSIAESPDPLTCVAVDETAPIEIITWSCPDDAVATAGAGPTLECNLIIDRAPVVATTTWSCPAGAESVGEGPALQCSRLVPATVNVPAVDSGTTIESCPPDSEAGPPGPNGGLTCFEVATTNVPAMITVVYICPTGSFVLDGEGSSLRCGRYETVPANAVNEFECPAGSFVVDDIRCARYVDSQLRPVVTITTSECPSGSGTLASGRCTVFREAGSNVLPIQRQIPTCPDGGRLIGSDCFEVSTEPVPGITTRTLQCLDGSAFEWVSFTCRAITSTTPKTCSSGQPVANGCALGAPIVTPMCPADFALVPAGDQCERTTDAAIYRLPTEVIADGCPDDTTPILRGTDVLACEQVTTTTTEVDAEVDTILICTEGILSETNAGDPVCVTTTTEVVYEPSSAITTTTYSCPAGYTATGEGADLVCSLESTETVAAIAITPTATAVPATPTATAVPATPTATAVPATPTATAVPATPTATAVPATPTATATTQPATTSTSASAGAAAGAAGTGVGDPIILSSTVNQAASSTVSTGTTAAGTTAAGTTAAGNPESAGATTPVPIAITGRSSHTTAMWAFALLAIGATIMARRSGSPRRSR